MSEEFVINLKEIYSCSEKTFTKMFYDVAENLGTATQILKFNLRQQTFINFGMRNPERIYIFETGKIWKVRNIFFWYCFISSNYSKKCLY